MSAEVDYINRPPHYTSHPSGIECIDIVEWEPYNIGCAMKYIWRRNLKGTPVVNLKKAIWYLQREIERLEKGGAQRPQP